MFDETSVLWRRRRLLSPGFPCFLGASGCPQRACARGSRARTAHRRHAWQHESRSARAATATAAATGQQHAHARRTASRTHRVRPPSAAASSSAADSRQTPRTNDDARRRKDAECPHGHKARDAGRWGTAILGGRPGNGVPALFLSCERGSHCHTAVVTRPRLSLAL